MLFVRSWARLLFWGHDSGPQVLQYHHPKLTVFEHLGSRFELVERDFTLFHPIPVTVKTVCRQNLMDVFRVGRCFKRVASTCCLAKDGEERNYNKRPANGQTLTAPWASCRYLVRVLGHF